jgi:hypothetical protein
MMEVQGPATLPEMATAEIGEGGSPGETMRVAREMLTTDFGHFDEPRTDAGEVTTPVGERPRLWPWIAMVGAGDAMAAGCVIDKEWFRVVHDGDVAMDVAILMVKAGV